MTRFLAVDLGDRRTGTATGDDQTGFAAPGTVLEVPRGPRLVAALVRAAAEADADALVLGLPLNMDDSEGPRARLTRTFAAELAAATGRPVHLQDERLTSFAAEEALAGSGRTRREKKRRRDALAAAELLRDFLEAGGPGASGAEVVRPGAGAAASPPTRPPDAGGRGEDRGRGEDEHG